MIGTQLVRFWTCIPAPIDDSFAKSWGIGLVLTVWSPGLVWKWT
jgi:hypothetical protein